MYINFCDYEAKRTLKISTFCFVLVASLMLGVLRLILLLHTVNACAGPQKSALRGL
jgi:hypothetical protein